MPDLSTLIAQGREHWKNHLPNKYARLKANGTLEKELAKAANQTSKEQKTTGGGRKGEVSDSACRDGSEYIRRESMPTIFDTPPQRVQDDLDGLSAALDTQVPTKSDDNLLVATWNIRSFASLTRFSTQICSPSAAIHGSEKHPQWSQTYGP